MQVLLGDLRLLTVDGSNPAPVEGKVVYPIIYRVFLHPIGGCLEFLNHQQ